MMDDRALDPLDVPEDCSIVELVYRLSRADQTVLELAITNGGDHRRLRFRGTRVVQFDKELPEVLHGLRVEDMGDKKVGDLSLWVSVGGGAITFWARSLTEVTKKTRSADAAPRPPKTLDQLRPWDVHGIPVESFSHRTINTGALRVFSISTRPYTLH
jgi:hypothetical protein